MKRYVLPLGRVSFLVGVLCCVSVVHAQPVSPEMLAFPCMACHGPEGESQGEIPSLKGRSYNDLKNHLQAFK